MNGLYRCGLAGTAAVLAAALAAQCPADDDTLRDLGTNAVPGEVAKWDGAAWRLAHDDVNRQGAGQAGSASVATSSAKSVPRVVKK